MGEGIGETDRELDALRERMRELESFDEVIAESVRRTRALLEEASDLRNRARAELAEARAEIDRDRAELVAIAQRILGGSTTPSSIQRPETTPPAPSLEPVAEPAIQKPAARPTEPAANNTIIVHGISRPAVATSLRAHLMAQQGVTAVDPREFAEGMLRLQVTASVPMTEGLFAGWKDGAGLTVVQQAPGTVEVVLPGA